MTLSRPPFYYSFFSVSVVTGRKRWVLLPPEVKKSIAKGLDVIRKGRYYIDHTHTHITPLILPLKPSHPVAILISMSIPQPPSPILMTDEVDKTTNYFPLPSRITLIP